MMAAMRCGLSLLATSIFCMATTIASVTQASVYFVAIGSTHYADAPPGARAFPRLAGANKSARVVGDRLARGGADGIVLTSKPDRFVTVADVYRVVDEMAAQVHARHDPAPFLLVYYAGHGISEGVGWNHFLVPGTFAFDGDSSALDVEGLAASTVHSAALVEKLNKTAIPYVLILDTCYEGNEANFVSSVLSGPAVESLKSVAGVLRFMNEFHQVNPVLFSTPPGTVVATADDPTDPSAEKVGPLGRRLMILLDPALQAHQAITLADLVQRMGDASLDPATRPAVTLATEDPSWAQAIIHPTGKDGATTTESASGETSVVCCARPAPAADEAPHRVTGRMTIEGTPGEYITGGGMLKIATPEYTLTLIEDKGAVRLEAEKGDDTWEVDLSAPGGGKLGRMVYRNAGRFGFVDDRAGIAITSPGRACNDLTGELDVADVRYGGAGHLIHLEAKVVQHCEAAEGQASAALRIDAVDGHR